MKADVDVAMTAGRLRAAADPLRWRILTLLAGEELCVCHLVEMLDVAQPLVSHHLRILRLAGLVESEKFRYWTYYRLKAQAVEDLGDQLAALARRASSSTGDRRRPCC